MAADVVGYSAMMERAEEATYAEIGRLRREIIEPRLAAHQGRLIKTTGDGILAEFASPVSAVRCAVDVQDQLAAAGEPIQLRIGINLGDVIVDNRPAASSSQARYKTKLMESSAWNWRMWARRSSRTFPNLFARTPFGDQLVSRQD